MNAEVLLITSYSQIGRLVLMLKGMIFKPGRALKVSLQWIDPRGTDAQRTKIRAMVRDIAKHTGYEADELYEYLLGAWWGTKRVEVLKGCFIERPSLRVSDMTVAQRSKHIDRLDELGREVGAWA